jgi:hypothetical protein
MSISGQQMELSLGLGVYIEGFKDGKARLCYPFTLENLRFANMCLSNFNQTDIRDNFFDDQKMIYLASFLKAAFRIDTDEDFQDLVRNNITDDNFAEIICDIKMVSGISDMDKGDIDFDKTFSNKGNSTDWDVTINSIPIYSSTPHSEIKNLTLTQLNKTLELIGKKINWEYKSATISLVKEPSDYIKQDEHPLYNNGRSKEHKNVTTMKDIMGFAGGE